MICRPQPTEAASYFFTWRRLPSPLVRPRLRSSSPRLRPEHRPDSVSPATTPSHRDPARTISVRPGTAMRKHADRHESLRPHISIRVHPCSSAANNVCSPRRHLSRIIRPRMNTDERRCYDLLYAQRILPPRSLPGSPFRSRRVPHPSTRQRPGTTRGHPEPQIRY